MMGVNKEISALIRRIYLGTEKYLPRIHIKRMDQNIFRRKCAALYSLYLKGDAVSSPCQHFSFITSDRLHKQIGMCLYGPAYRICKPV